jgi:hypothetical protein
LVTIGQHVLPPKIDGRGWRSEERAQLGWNGEGSIGPLDPAELWHGNIRVMALEERVSRGDLLARKPVAKADEQVEDLAPFDLSDSQPLV